jgi:hypothetical protein
MIDARQQKIDVVLFFDLSRLTRKGLFPRHRLA